MKVSRITMGRLFNLGSYEHVRYELTVEVTEGESATAALAGIERIFAALDPKRSTTSESEIEHDKRRIARMKELADKGEAEFNREYGYNYVGTRQEYIARCEDTVNESISKRNEWKERSRKARELLDDLGGAAVWRDAKLEWDNEDWP